MQAPDPLDRFLSVPPEDRHPARILRLDTHEPTSEQIRAALERRLAEIDNHPWASTPEADEARLAVHAAAVQLADPEVARSLAAPTPPMEPTGTAPQPATHHPRSQRPAPPATPFARDALLALAIEGGWRSSLLRRVVLLAHVHGVEPAQVPEILRGLVPAGTATGVSPDSLAGVSAAPAIETGPSQDPVLTVLGVLGGGAVLLTIAAMVLSGLLGDRARPAPTPAQKAQAAPAQATTPSLPDASPDQRSPRRTDNELAHLLATAPMQAGPDELAASIDRWMTLVSDRLIEMPSGPAAAIVASLRERALRCARLEDGSKRLVEVLRDRLAILRTTRRTAGAAAAVPGAALAGELALFVAADPSTPRRAVEDLQFLLEDAGIGRSASAGATARAIADRLASSDVAAWRAWLALTQQRALVAPASRPGLLRGALTGVVQRSTPDNRDAQEVARLLAEEIDWRTDRRAQAWLTQVLRSGAPTSPAMVGVTEAIAGASAVPNINALAVLPQGAETAARERVAAFFDDAWTALIDNADPFIREWLAALDPLLTPEAYDEPLENIRRAARLADLSASAFHWSLSERSNRDAALGHEQAADQTAQPVPDAPERVTDSQSTQDASEASWAVAYLRLRSNTGERVAMLRDRRDDTGDLSVLGARVVAREAFRGSPRTVREEAALLLARHADEPAVLEAALDLLDSAPRSEHTADLVATLTGSDAPLRAGDAWDRVARTALLEQLLFELGDQGLGDAIDRAAADLAAAYAARLGEADARGRPAHAMARLVRLSTPLLDSPYLPAWLDIDAIDDRRRTRALLAADAVEQFHAEQRAVCEQLGAMLISMDPARSGSVEAILSDLEARLAQTPTLSRQILAVEISRASLWRIAVEESP